MNRLEFGKCMIKRGKQIVHAEQSKCKHKNTKDLYGSAADRQTLDRLCLDCGHKENIM